MHNAATDNISPADRIVLLEDEQLIIRTSGEIPEVALHGSLYYLSCDPEGPGVILSPAEVDGLAIMAIERYREIILRDLTPENRRQRIYRGLARAAVNWQRLAKFSSSRSLCVERIKREISEALIRFLDQEIDEVISKNMAPSCVNCSRETLATMARDLELSQDALPHGWQSLCLEE